MLSQYYYCLSIGHKIMSENNVAVTPNEEEVTNEVAEPTPEVTKADGLAEDGTQYSEESAEVAKFMELFPEVELDAAIGSVVVIHNNIIAGNDIAGADSVKEVIDMISEKLLANSEEAPAEEVPAADGMETADGVKAPAEEEKEVE